MPHALQTWRSSTPACAIVATVGSERPCQKARLSASAVRGGGDGGGTAGGEGGGDEGGRSGGLRGSGAAGDGKGGLSGGGERGKIGIGGENGARGGKLLTATLAARAARCHPTA